MATDIARAFFIGRLTRDIEVLFSGNGNLFGVITVAVNVYQGKNLPEKTSFFRLTVPGRTVDSIGTYLTKGRQIAVDAVPVMASWTDANGEKRTRVQFDVTNIQLLSGRRGGSSEGEREGAGERETRKEPAAAQAEADTRDERLEEAGGDPLPSDSSGEPHEERFEDDLPF